MGVRILSTGSYVPKKVLTNFDITKIVDTSDEWIQSRTGIIERRIASNDETTSDMASIAVSNALNTCNIGANDLDLIIVATVTPDTLFPSTAAHVQRKIGANKAVCFDIQAACSGMIYGLEIIVSMMKFNKRYKKAALIGADKLSSITDWSDRGTCILFGDAAGAVILENIEDKDDVILSSALYTDGNYADLLLMPGGGTRIPLNASNINDKLNCIRMHGNKVFKLAVNSMFDSCTEVMKLINMKVSDIDWLISHQANIRIIDMLGLKLEFPKEKVAVNIHKYGNTSAASIFLVLDEFVKSDKIKSNQKILLTAFGGGMTWGSMIIEL